MAARRSSSGSERDASRCRSRNAGSRCNGVELSKTMAERLRSKPGGEHIEVTIGDFAATTVQGTFSVAYLRAGRTSPSERSRPEVACSYKHESKEIPNAYTDPFPFELTPRAARILASAGEQCTRTDHRFIGVEHIFLAVLGEGESVPAQVLRKLRATALAQQELDAWWNQLVSPIR